MWSVIEASYAKLSKGDKERVAKQADPLGKHVSFYGFDGTYEGEHLSVAGILIKDLERFSAFKDRALNSHSPSLEGHRRMLRVFEPMRRTLMRGNLGAEQIIKLLNASQHDGGSW
jgi:uncharacterized protein YfbU (UPF0304 family)